MYISTQMANDLTKVINEVGVSDIYLASENTKAKISNVNIACDAALDQDVNQEIGFLGEQDKISYLEYEEQRDQLERELYGICECCNGTGQYMDYNPHSSRYVPCDNCNGTGYLKEDTSICPRCNDNKIVESNIPMVGNEECYFCKDQNDG